MKEQGRKYTAARRAVSLLLILVLSLLAAVTLTGCGEKDKNEVLVYCYGDYIDPSVVKQFQKETGIKVVLDTFDTNEEMYPVIKNHAGVYDVICPSDYMIEKMRTEGLLQKIDFSKVPNIKYIGKQYLKIADKTYDPGNKYAVPYQWGVAGIMYNKKKLGDGAVTSWKDLWNKKYKGSILMQDSVRDTLMVALKKDGYSLNTTRKSQLKRAVNDLIAQRPLVYKYVNDSARDLLIGNSAKLGVVWNGEVIYSQKLNKNLAFCVPKEGSELFIDNWVIPKNAFHKTNAEKWINFLCRPDIAYKNFKYLTYSTPNEGARKLMPAKYRNNPNLFLSDKQLAKCQVLRDLGPDGDDLYSTYWKIFKSSN
ncbi:MAG: ABC transporter substrate-binding protein [Eubacterium sp.]|jgi:spermidine/putrescine transport system substrate-binding protein